MDAGRQEGRCLRARARGLIGIDPPAALVTPLLDYLEETSVAAKRGGSRDNVKLARSALERLVDTKDRATLGPVRDQLRITQGAWATLLPLLDRFSPRPDDWTAVLLDHTAHADRDTAWEAWGLLGKQLDAALLAQWTPRAAEEDRLSAVQVLGAAADTSREGRNPEAIRAAQAHWLAACEPVMKGGKPGKAFETCVRPSSFAFANRKDLARHLASWLAANPDAGAKVELLGRLEGLWSEAFDATDTVKAELANPDPRVKQATEKALDRIRPAWREAGARAERKAAAAPAPKAASTTSGPGADGAALYGAIRVGDVAQVKKLVTASSTARSTCARPR